MSKDGIIQMSSFSAADLRGERMSAFVRTVSQTISSEMSLALITGKAAEPPKALVAAAKAKDRKPQTIGEVTLKHFGKRSAKERRHIAGTLMTRDIMTGQKLSNAERGEMRALLGIRRSTHAVEDKELIARLARILQPATPIKPKDHKSWNRHWLHILHGTLGGPTSIANPGGGANPPQHTQLQFRLHEVICNDDTNELGQDEIAVGAVSTHGTMDENDNVTSAADPEITYPHDLGQYRTGDSRTLGPLNVETFTLSGLSFPRLFIVNLALAEVDSGGFADFLEDLYAAVEIYLTAIITAVGVAIGAAIGTGAAAGGLAGSAAGPIGSLIGAAIGVVVGAIVAAVSAASQDEIFEVQSCAIELSSRSELFNGSNETPVENLTYMGFGGEYTLRYNWRLT